MRCEETTSYFFVITLLAIHLTTSTCVVGACGEDGLGIDSFVPGGHGQPETAVGIVALEAAGLPPQKSPEEAQPEARMGVRRQLRRGNRAMLAAATTSAAAAGGGSAGGAAAGRPLLLPLLPYGLSNQVLALKEVLALAAVLNWSVATYGFWPHSSELAAAAAAAAGEAAAGEGAGSPGGEGFRLQAAEEGKGTRAAPREEAEEQGGVALPTIPFDLVFDRQSLASVVRVASWEEVLQDQREQRQQQHQQQQQPELKLQPDGAGEGGKSGRGLPEGDGSGGGGGSSGLHVAADAVVSLSPMSGFGPTLDKAGGAGLLTVPQSVKAVKNHAWRCDDRGLTWLRDAASRDGWRAVALFAYRRVVGAARSSFRSFANDSSPCARAYHQVSLHLAKSAVVAATARDFVMAALGSSSSLQHHDSSSSSNRSGGDDASSGDSSSRSSGSSSSGDGGGGGSSGGADVPYYVALHVRPYPDSCMEYFVNMTDFDLADAKKVCRNPRLLEEMVPLVRQQLLRAQAGRTVEAAAAAAAAGAGSAAAVAAEAMAEGARTAVAAAAPAAPPAGLFIMSHPRVREVVRRELRRLWAEGQSGGADRAGAASGRRQAATAGRAAARRKARGGRTAAAAAEEDEEEEEAAEASASPHQLLPLALPRLFFLDVADLPAELRHQLASTSLLSVVEQEVCRTASVFIGTASSSISVMVAQERTAVDSEAAAAGEPTGRVTVLL